MEVDSEEEPRGENTTTTTAKKTDNNKKDKPNNNNQSGKRQLERWTMWIPLFKKLEADKSLKQLGFEAEKLPKLDEV